MTETARCPRCGDPMDPRLASHSRTAADTGSPPRICSACGYDEAMIQLNPLPRPDEWPVKRRFERTPPEE